MPSAGFISVIRARVGRSASWTESIWKISATAITIRIAPKSQPPMKPPRPAVRGCQLLPPMIRAMAMPENIDRPM